MTRSTAGVGLDPLRWLGQVAGEHAGAVFCVAAAVGASPDPATGHYGATRNRLAELAHIRRDTVWPCLRTLTADGYLEPARRGGGRARPSLFQLAQPALIPAPQEGRFGRFDVDTDPPGGPLWSIPAPQEGRFGVDTDPPGGPLSPIPAPQEGRFTPLLNTARPAGAGGAGAGDPLPPRTPIVEDLIARLPVRLHPRSRGGREAVADVLAELLAVGWRPADIVLVADEPLPAEPIEHPWAFLRARFRGRPVPVRDTTPTPERVQPRLEQVDPDRLVAGVGMARAALRGAS